MNSVLLSKIVKQLKSSGGVTFNTRLNKFVAPKDYWMFPKYPSKTKILPVTINLEIEINKFINKNINSLNETDTYFGIWLNPKSNKYYFDINTFIKDKAKALDQARSVSKVEGRNIVAMFNPKRDKTIFL